jgi:hypothetical protein
MAYIDFDIDIYLTDMNVRSVLFVNSSYSYSPTNVSENIAKALKYSISRILPVAAKVHGFWVEFYYPRHNRSSAYGHFSDDQGYVGIPDVRTRAVVTGSITDRMNSGDNIDNYFGPPPIIYLVGDKSDLPENTKIRVLFGVDKYVEFQADRCDVIYGLDNALITKIALLPVSAQH